MKTFASLMMDLAQRNSPGAVFSDFLEIVVCTLSLGRKEARYLELISRYKKSEVDTIVQAFAAMVLEMDNRGEGLKDVLGDYFTEFITRGHNGQFFTPDSVADFMAQIAIGDAKPGQTVNDCACGSGRTLLSTAKVNRHLVFFGADVDRNCAMMTAINLVLNGLKGEVAWMNTLSMEFYGGWHIYKYPVPHLIEISKEQCYQAGITFERKEPEKQVFVDVAPAIFGEQLTLF